MSQVASCHQLYPVKQVVQPPRVAARVENNLSLLSLGEQHAHDF
jgi:hypothetical protein